MELDKELALKALAKLDEKLVTAQFPSVVLAVGGGGSMILEHGYQGATEDIDAVPLNSEFEPLKPFMTEVAQEMHLAADWLNPHYGSFTLYLPADSKSRMTNTYVGQKLTVKTLGAVDILIMKLMAGRAKDIPHIRHLLKKKIDLTIVENRLEELKNLFPKIAENALDLFDELTGEHD